MTPVIWRLSHKWANHQLDCTLWGIVQRCHAGCCTSGPSGTFWPGRTGETGSCPRLGPAGCTYEAHDKPIRCLLFPFRLNPSGTLVLHDKSLIVGCCRLNNKLGPRAIVALRSSFVALFGDAQTDDAIEVTASLADAFLVPAPGVLEALEREAEWERQGVPPSPRGGAPTILLPVLQPRLF